MRICFIASEVAPLAKTGGLADVAGALGKYLHAGGHDIRVFMPCYAQIDRTAHAIYPVEFLHNIPLTLGTHKIVFSVLTLRLPGSENFIYLIDCPALYARATLYTDDRDDHLRFLVLTHAAILCCQRMGFAPHILHCNDWHTAFGPLLLKTVYAWDELFRKTRSVFTIHNIGYQGGFPAAASADVGLLTQTSMLEPPDAYGQINALKHGILHADHINTVSPTYAAEIQTDAYGMGMQAALRTRAASLSGILNGVDYDEWDPRNDRYLPLHYNAAQLGVKATLKQQLLKRLQLHGGERTPLIGIVSRLAVQKGFDLVMEVLPAVLDASAASLVVLGTGEARYETFFGKLSALHPSRVAFHRGYSDELAHWIVGASDMFLMPSQYEPCGLNQMYSLRYGTIPIVRRTGGLADSVQHFDTQHTKGTGIVFNDYDAIGLRWALDTALSLYAR
ncbi:MAG: glycogen synthase, partial [Steroidobacteraceae bacterium]